MGFEAEGNELRDIKHILIEADWKMSIESKQAFLLHTEQTQSTYPSSVTSQARVHFIAPQNAVNTKTAGRIIGNKLLYPLLK